MEIHTTHYFYNPVFRRYYIETTVFIVDTTRDKKLSGLPGESAGKQRVAETGTGY